MVALATTDDLTRFGYVPPASADALLDRASARIRLAAGHQEITSDTSVVTFPPSPERERRLWQFPATLVHTVVRLDTQQDITADCDLVGNDLVLPQYADFDYLFPTSGPAWYAFTAIMVTYDHGFQTLPDELVELVCSVAMRLSGTKPDRDMAVSAQAVGDVSQTINPAALQFNAGLLPSEEATIRRIFYRRG